METVHGYLQQRGSRVLLVDTGIPDMAKYIKQVTPENVPKEIKPFLQDMKIFIDVTASSGVYFNGAVRVSLSGDSCSVLFGS